MKLVLSVSAIGEQAEGRCPWMWLDLGPRLAQKALDRIDVFRLAEEKDDEVTELYYVSLDGFSSTRGSRRSKRSRNVRGSLSKAFWHNIARTLENGRKFPMNSLSPNGPWCARRSRK